MMALQYEVVEPYNIMQHPQKSAAYAVIQEACGLPTTSDEYFTAVADRHVVLALDRGTSTPLGVVVLDLESWIEPGAPEGQKHAYLQRIAVKHGLQSVGLGSLVLGFCEQYAAANGCVEMSLEPASERAAAFYVNNDYRINPDCADEMLKDLTS